MSPSFNKTSSQFAINHASFGCAFILVSAVISSILSRESILLSLDFSLATTAKVLLQILSSPLSNSVGASKTTAVSLSNSFRWRFTSAIIYGNKMLSNSVFFSWSLNTIIPSFRRSKTPSLTTPLKAFSISVNAGAFCAVTSREILSQSMLFMHFSFNRLQTVDLPAPVCPVSPIIIKVYHLKSCRAD